MSNPVNKLKQTLIMVRFRRPRRGMTDEEIFDQYIDLSNSDLNIEERAL